MHVPSVVWDISNIDEWTVYVNKDMINDTMGYQINLQTVCVDKSPLQ